MLPLRTVIPAFVLLGVTLTPVRAQNTLDKSQKDRAAQMVRDLAEAMRKHYFDPGYKGIDMPARFKTAEEAVQNAADFGQVFGIIATTLDALNDSHTFFEPPARNTTREFGLVQRMIGDKCFITAVRPNSDASEKLAPGDEVLAIEGNVPTRNNLWKLNYAFNQLYAMHSLRYAIRHPDGTQREVVVSAKVRQGKRVLDLASGEGDIWQLLRDQENEEHLTRQRFAEVGDALLIWKMPEFDMTDDEVDRMIKRAQRRKTLILDLRGNPGGYVKTLQYTVGSVMDHEVLVANRKGRKPDLKPTIAKTRGSSAFQGKLIVLVDSRSASAAELFARVVQLEQRGTVLGDHSSGSVMESRYYGFDQGADTKILYGASVTDADLVMTDGKSLEHTGVTPDELILPTQADLASGRDPVLSRAAALAGVAIDPVEAGKLFPEEWRPN